MKRTLIAAVIIFLLSIGAAFADEDVIQFEYGGRIIEVRLEDLILTQGGVELFDPSMFGFYDYYYDDFVVQQEPPRRVITEAEYREEQRAHRWLSIVEDLELREIDQRALELVREFNRATHAVPPMLGQAGAIVFNFATYIPTIVARPMFVTDVILQPGEIVTGIHPGDTVRWTFTPGEIGEGANRQVSVLIKPLMPDISTNLIIMTNRRRYHLNLVSSATEFMPSVSFSYPEDGMRVWDDFIRTRRQERDVINVADIGHRVNPEDIHLNYSIEGPTHLRWRPVAVYDDGIRTFIRFPRRSTIRSVEAPVFVVLERRREILVNYRWVEDMMIVDRVFDVGALIVGPNRIIIRRLS